MNDRANLFTADDEREFKRSFAIQCMAALEAVNYDQHCYNGWKGHRLPVEDSACLAEKAWDDWVEVIGVDVCNITPPGESQPPLTPEQAEEFRRELDSTPATEEWARVHAVDTQKSGDVTGYYFDADKHSVLWAMPGMPLIIRDFTGANIRLKNPSIGQVRTALRLANITLKEPSNAQ